jgi:hypothetical protein
MRVHQVWVVFQGLPFIPMGVFKLRNENLWSDVNYGAVGVSGEISPFLSCTKMHRLYEKTVSTEQSTKKMS